MSVMPCTAKTDAWGYFHKMRCVTMKKKQWVAIGCFSLLMFGLSISDALRGIFSPVFQERYQLNEAELSQLLTVSYIGNLLFLSVGGKLLDKFGKKSVMLAMMLIWGFSLLLNVVTDSYGMILLSVFFALGTSTLLNTSVNLSTPLISTSYAGLLVNIFFFVQGIGTSASQFLLGKYLFSYQGWRLTCIFLVGIAVFSLALFLLSSIARKTPSVVGTTASAQTDLASSYMPKRIVFWMFAAMMGCYFIAEHSVMNRLMSYCLTELQMESAQASVILSTFWASMTVGRLIFAPVVQKLGNQKSITIFGATSVILFAGGCILARSGVYLLAISGLAISILYPTMLLFLQQLYPANCVAAKTGAIISIATIADIVFNAGFGFVLAKIGYHAGFLILPCFLLGFYLLYLVIAKQSKVHTS